MLIIPHLYDILLIDPPWEYPERNEIGKDLSKHLLVRKMINNLSPSAIQLFMNASSLLGIGNLIKNYDMERIQSIFSFKP